MNAPLSSRALGGALAIGFLASCLLGQGSYQRFGAACPSALGIPLSLNGSPPVRGQDASVWVSGPAGALAVLVVSPTPHWTGVDLGGIGATGCRRHYQGVTSYHSIPLGRTGNTRFRYFVPPSTPLATQIVHQAYAFVPGANPRGVLYSNGGRAIVGNEPPLTPADIRRLAPLVRLHPTERFGPMDPMTFLRSSRFRHHRSWARDQGYNKRLRRWVTTNSKHADYFDVPVRTINSYTLMRGSKNRRPRDKNASGSFEVFVQPEGRPTGARNPNGVVPVFYYYRRQGSLHTIQYWWFFGFNDGSPGELFDHQGDWEHVTLHVAGGRITGAWFSAHKSGHFHPRSEIRFAAGRPIVYIARGTHAAYNRPGSHHILGTDKTADFGVQWNTSLRLLRLDDQPWKDFAGAWGEVGEREVTTGPLGPWHKRFGS